MVDALQTIKGLTLERAPWSDVAENFLAKIDHDCPVSFYKSEVKSGCACLLNVKTDNGDIVAVVVTRVDDTAEGREFVIVAAGGECAGRLMTLDVLPVFEEHARAIGCACVRAHTRRNAVVSGFQRAGFSIDEYVLKKRVA